MTFFCKTLLWQPDCLLQDNTLAQWFSFAEQCFGNLILWQNIFCKTVLWQNDTSQNDMLVKSFLFRLHILIILGYTLAIFQNNTWVKATGFANCVTGSRNVNGRRITNPKVSDLFQKNRIRDMRSKRTRRNLNYSPLSLVLVAEQNAACAVLLAAQMVVQDWVALYHPNRGTTPGRRRDEALHGHVLMPRAAHPLFRVKTFQPSLHVRHSGHESHVS